MPVEKRVDVKVGFGCNNNCRFCVQAEKRRWGNKSTKQVYQDLEEAHRNGCRGVVFTGGEPAINDSILEFIGYAKETGFKTIQVQTNGRMLAYKNFCRQLIGAGANEFSPALHGHIAPLHDYLTRSPGSFKQTIKGIRNLRELGQRVITNTVVTKPNYRHLPEIAELLVKLDVDQFQFAFVHPIGNALKNFDSVVPRISLAAPYVHRGLKIGIDAGKAVMAEAMPFCLMEGYEDYVSERYIPPTEIRDAGYYIPDYGKERKSAGKKKFPECRRCKYDLVCEGPWKEYPEMLGSDEFRPVPGGNRVLARPQGSKRTARALETKVRTPSHRHGNIELWQNPLHGPAILGVLHGLKPVSKLEHITLKEARSLIPQLEYMGLTARIPDQRFMLDASGTEFRRSSKGSEGEYVYLFVSKDAGKLEEAVEATTQEHKGKGNRADAVRKLGALLGYPRCCTEAFGRERDYANDKQMNMVIRGRTRGRLSPYLNNLVSPFSLVPFFPCTYNCMNAGRFAKDMLDIVSEGDDERKYKIMGTLRSVVLYFDLWRYVVFPGARAEDGRIRYDGFRPSLDFLGSMMPKSPEFREFLSVLEGGDVIVVKGDAMDVIKGESVIHSFSQKKLGGGVIFDFS